jgi:hypothetical protein
MFRAISCSSSGGQTVLIRHLVSSLSISDRPVLCTGWSLIDSDDTRCRINPLNAELNPICHSLILLGNLTFMGTCIVSIFQYISNKMQRYTVYLYLETALYVSGGTFTHHQERIHLYLQHLLFVTTLLLSAAIVEELEQVWVYCGWRRHPQHTQTGSNSSTIAADSSNGVTYTRCCRYSCMRFWCWVKVPPETCRAVSRYK